MQWKVSTPDLLKEMVQNNPTAWILRMPILIFRNILGSLAERAIELDDPQLNILMLRLGLYEVHPRDVDTRINEQRARLN